MLYDIIYRLQMYNVGNMQKHLFDDLFLTYYILSSLTKMLNGGQSFSENESMFSNFSFHDDWKYLKCIVKGIMTWRQFQIIFVSVVHQDDFVR